jgi:hypothetical protein
VARYAPLLGSIFDKIRKVRQNFREIKHFGKEHVLCFRIFTIVQAVARENATT